MGTRFQKQIVKFDFQGITLRPAQVEMIQRRVDELNNRRSEQAGTTGGAGQSLEGNKFLDDANKQLKDFFTQVTMGEKSGGNDGGGGSGGGSGSGSDGEGAVGFSNRLASVDVASDRSIGAVDISELRFLSQEPQGERPTKERWDNYYYDNQPLSTLELMVKHRRRQPVARAQARVLVHGCMLRAVRTTLRHQHRALAAHRAATRREHAHPAGVGNGGVNLGRMVLLQ